MVDPRSVAKPSHRHLGGVGAPSEGGRDSRAGSRSPDTEVDEHQATDAEIDRLAAALTRLLAECWRSGHQGKDASWSGTVGVLSTENESVSASEPATIGTKVAGCPSQEGKL